MSSTNSAKPYTTGSVTSADGTVIGYRQMGVGPAVILLHGGLQSSQNFMRLAGALADAFTLYVPDRRGRGLSGGFAYSMQNAVEDVSALLERSGAQRVFGLSSGALIALQSALQLPQITKLALYEPPLSVHGSTPVGWLPRFDQEVSQGRLGSALVTTLQGLEDDSFLTKMPRALTTPFLNLAIKPQGSHTQGDEAPLGQIVPTMHYDIELVKETADRLTSYAAVTADVLLLGGSKSQNYLRYSLDQLERVLPHARRIEFAGANHIAADNDGQPKRVAEELLYFFFMALASPAKTNPLRFAPAVW